MKKLHKKVALITGSTSGIGLSIAEELANLGATIILNGLGSMKQVDPIIESLSRKTSQDVMFFDTNLADVSAIESMMTEIQTRFGGVDILVNNAGLQHVASVQDFSPEKWDLLLAVNLSSAFHTCRLALPHMVSKGWGRIINVSSAHGLVASAQKSAYVAAKHGLIGLSKVIALETAGAGITCNSICPGWVLTPLVEKQIHERAAINNQNYDQAKHDLLWEKQPSLQFVKPEHIGELVGFLCSSAAEQITGSAISMDGGWTAR
jgi:3-hydroxybutyrate dehydrogenase